MHVASSDLFVYELGVLGISVIMGDRKFISSCPAILLKRRYVDNTRLALSFVSLTSISLNSSKAIAPYAIMINDQLILLALSERLVLFCCIIHGELDTHKLTITLQFQLKAAVSLYAAAFLW
jgi:hypothetical protein